MQRAIHSFLHTFFSSWSTRSFFPKRPFNRNRLFIFLPMRFRPAPPSSIDEYTTFADIVAGEGLLGLSDARNGRQERKRSFYLYSSTKRKWGIRYPHFTAIDEVPPGSTTRKSKKNKNMSGCRIPCQKDE